jgi:hypothetical protein
LVVFVVKGSKVGKGLVKMGIKVVGVWYRVKTDMNAGRDSRCELCCGWGLIDSICDGKSTFDYWLGHHQTSEHKCNVVGCTAK